MEAKPAPNSEFGAGLEEQKIDREAALPNHIVYDLVCDTMWYKPKSKQKHRGVKTQRSFSGAPDWIRTSGLPCRSSQTHNVKPRFQVVFHRLCTNKKTIQKAREAFSAQAPRAFVCVVVKWWSRWSIFPENEV